MVPCSFKLERRAKHAASDDDTFCTIYARSCFQNLPNAMLPLHASMQHIGVHLIAFERRRLNNRTQPPV